MSEPRLDWNSAKVADSKLSVDVSGELSSEWKQSFQTTAQLLRGGEWGEVVLKKQTVIVQDITPGSEDKLRHHLESIVEQANATGQEEEPSSAEATGDSEPRDSDGPDAEMTSAFRSFADTEKSDEESSS
jgi:hypothetical protein